MKLFLCIWIIICFCCSRVVGVDERRFVADLLRAEELQRQSNHGKVPVEKRLEIIKLYESALDGEQLTGELESHVKLKLAQMYAKTSMLDQALTLLDELIETASPNARAEGGMYFERSEVHSFMKNKALALKDLVRSIVASPPGIPNAAYAFSLWSKSDFEQHLPTELGDYRYEWFIANLRNWCAQNADKINTLTIHEGMYFYAMFNIVDRQARELPLNSKERSQAASEAWEWLRIGSEVTRRFVDADENTFKAQHHVMQSVFTRDVFRFCQANGIGYSSPDGSNVVVVVGLPRSGSTLVEHILAAHSKVTGLGEESELTFFLPEFKSKVVAAFTQENVNLTPLKRWMEIHCARVFSQMKARHENKHLQNIIFVDKMLFHYLHVGLIHLAFPKAKIIHVFKADKNDAIFSLYKRQFPVGTAPWSYRLEEIRPHFVHYQRLMEHWRTSLPPTAFLEQSYEQLVQDFERSAKRLVEFIGLEWESQLLHFSHVPKNRDRVVLTHSASQVSKPLSTTSIGAWKLYETFIIKDEGEEEESCSVLTEE